MATTTYVSVLSEAEFGCEHVATVLTQDEGTAGQFKDRFVKTYESLAPNSKLARISIEKNNGKLGTLLKPRYTCLLCSEACFNGDRKTHTEKTGHQLYMESRTRTMFCESCGDFVYDHGLERHRATAAGIPINVSIKREVAEDPADEIYVKNNATKKPCARQGVRGLFNLGQTCYQNVILQSMFHAPLLNAYFLGDGHKTYDCPVADCAGCAIAEAFYEHNSGEKPEGISVLHLLHTTWKTNSNMAGCAQQDAHEYYQWLVNALHSTTHGHSDDHGTSCSCFFHKAFYGKLLSTVTCDKCGNVTRTEDPMMDLSLDVYAQVRKRASGMPGTPTTPTLSSCLENFTSPEKLPEGVYNCSGCGGTPQEATKQLSLKKLPAILCIQLKRFVDSPNGLGKVEGRVYFPLSFNMAPFTSNPDIQQMDNSSFVYDLISVAVHRGSLDAGHYYAYCRQGDQWLLFNDDQVTQVTEAEALSANAYLLFYSLRFLNVEKQ